MTDHLTTDGHPELHPVAAELVQALARDAGSRVDVVRGDGPTVLRVEETSGRTSFIEVDADEFRIVPLREDDAAMESRPFVREVRQSREGEREVVVDVAALSSYADRGQVIDLMHAALDYWTGAASPDDGSDRAAPALETTVMSLPAETPGPVESPEAGPREESTEAPTDDETAADTPSVRATVRADIADQWSWPSSSARIPQISDLEVQLSEQIDQARIRVTVADAEIQFGATVVYEGALSAGTSAGGSVHVPLSASAMSRVEERRGADCRLVLEDAATGRVLARYEEPIEVQPRDLWFWDGDPRRSEQRGRLDRLVAALHENPERSDRPEIEAEIESLKSSIGGTGALARSLLAAFVRPNHPEIASIAREAADRLGKATGDGSFYAFQLSDVAAAEKRADETVTAIYEALQARSIAYSEPPPGWDYSLAGQRIRDHGDVARGGLGTCMDTTVLTAAVIEQVGLHPVLVLISGHIFIGYWRRDPTPAGGARPQWYPDTPVVRDPAAARGLVEGGFLGVIETTDFTAGPNVSAGKAQRHAKEVRFASGVADGTLHLIDVAAARRAGVSPLPAVTERADGVTEIVEYRPGGAVAVTAVEEEAADTSDRERQVDDHPARYRTWKSSLFSLNATNALLNLGNNARVQPIALPPEALGTLEDKLNQDVSFSLYSGYDIPEVWRARDIGNAMDLLRSGERENHDELVAQMNHRRLYLQRRGRARGEVRDLTASTFFREIRSMAHNAKTARDERGMNPLFLGIGLLRWPHKPGALAEAPLILVPVNIAVTRGRQEFTLSLDSSQQTTPNAALIEWLRQEHGVSVPGLAEPMADRAGIDVDAVLSEVRSMIAETGLALDVSGEARITTLDLSAFRMWQDLNLNADHFFERPLVNHLVHTPSAQFIDPAIDDQRDTDDSRSSKAGLAEEELEQLETPIPADSTQKQAVLWASQGRTFVLEGPPGTGKSQTITNMVAECLLSGLRVLFVAEKGTALSVVQRRLEEIGLGPFTLNLHHEGSNAAEVRQQLKRSLAATVDPDTVAMESARRQLRNARFELTQYPDQLHRENAAGFSAYSALDELLVLGEGSEVSVPATLVARQGEQVQSLSDLFQDLQRWTAAAAVRPEHPWRLAGVGAGDPFDIGEVSAAVRGILEGLTWSSSLIGPLGEALDSVTRPAQLTTLASAADSTLPAAEELAGVLDDAWPIRAPQTLSGCERTIEEWAPKLHGFGPEVLDLDLRGIATQLENAIASGFFGRKGRQREALAPLAAIALADMELAPADAGAILADLIGVQDAAQQVRGSVGAIPGLARTVPDNPFREGALAPARACLAELERATAGLRDGGEWTQRVHELARGGHLAGHADALTAYATSWKALWDQLAILDDDFEAWRNDESLQAATTRVEERWRWEVDHERLVPLQRWCALVRRLEPLRTAGLGDTRGQLLEGRLPADSAESALARGIARTSLSERVRAEGLDRFDAVAHDQRVTAYSQAQRQVREQWVTEGPSRLLEKRSAGSVTAGTGGLARELQKTTRKLGTRRLLHKYGDAVQTLTPLVLCSPSSVVDLINPEMMEFDLAIFDEASQITVPEAVGSLGRARAAIVVGDSKQMPPTRKVGGGSVDEEELDDDPDAEEIVEDQESILSECELSRVPKLSLSWHYRSQDEALIAFSNRAYYKGNLSSFPAPSLLSSVTGVQFRRVDGRYLRAGSEKVELENGVVAGSNTNPDEARALVEEVHRLVHASEQLPSIGVVTFNEHQRQLIEDMLSATPDSKIAAVMDASRMGRGDVLFVKALEQVQGDERDTILFSVAFSKQANGKIPTNFGPLSQGGGERRLNVAITRARRKNVVFCSFDPAELDVSSATHDGPKHLKEFLAFVKSAGSLDEEEGPGRSTPIRDRHRDEIAAALREAGLHVMSDVGLSNFRIDLVLARPESPDKPVLPVLLDGTSWQKRNTVSDRDVLPVEVLENLMGWPSVARIWWPMWVQNREEVIRKVLDAVDQAETELPDGTTTAESTLVGAVTAMSDSSMQLESDQTRDADSMPLAGLAQAPATEPRPAEDGATAGEAPDVADSEATPPGARPLHASNEPDQPDTGPVAPEGATIPESEGAGGQAERSAADGLTAFFPAHTNVVGSKDVLDRLSDRAAAASVREQILEVIETEGPVELGRLARIVARRFGLSAVRAARVDDIVKLVPREQLRKDRTLGDFAWPRTLDPDTWTGFRFDDRDNARVLDEVAPQEIANGMLAVLAEDDDLERVDDLLRRTAELFGVTRLGAKVRSRLEAVYATLPRKGFSE